MAKGKFQNFDFRAKRAGKFSLEIPDCNMKGDKTKILKLARSFAKGSRSGQRRPPYGLDRLQGVQGLASESLWARPFARCPKFGARRPMGSTVCKMSQVWRANAYELDRLQGVPGLASKGLWARPLARCPRFSAPGLVGSTKCMVSQVWGAKAYKQFDHEN